MKSIISVMALGALCCISSAARAERVHNSHSGFLHEHPLKLGVDTEISMPVGNYSDVNSVGGGLMVTSELALTESLAGTARIGYQMHVDRTQGPLSMHVNSIPFLLGGKYYLSSEHQGMFATAELGMFELISSVTQANVSASTGDLKFGAGVGLGIQQNQWNARVSMHSQDFGNFGSAMMISGGIGYQFGAL